MMVEVVEATAIYAVLYMGKPINLRSRHSLINYPGMKYHRISHANPGHAHKLCARLNRQFNTDQFTVHLMATGEQVFETKEKRVRNKRESVVDS